MSDLRFDWCDSFQSPLIDGLMATVVGAVNASQRSTRGLSEEQRSERALQWEKIAKLMLTSLYNAYFVLPEPVRVSVPKTKAAYKKDSSDAGKLSLSFRNMNDVYTALEKELQWIGTEPGKEGKGYTRIWAAGELASIFDNEGLKWHKQDIKGKEASVVLRDRDTSSKAAIKNKKKITLTTPETKEVQQHRDRLYQINSFLTEHCISIDLNDDRLAEMAREIGNQSKEDDYSDVAEDSKDFDIFRVQLRRIFSRGDMEKGGRFYNGWWQSLPSRYRPHITIDGLKTCEVDFSAVQLNILYSHKDIAFPADQDAYDIGLDDWNGPNDPRREHIKTFVSALINDEEGNYSLSKEKQSAVGISHKALKEKVLEKHKAIADLFSTGIGLTGQYIDSQIAERVILTMMHDGIVVLPIHDSFIVRAGYQRWVEEVMIQAFYEITGGKASVKVDGPRLQEHFNMQKEEFEQVSREPEDNVVNTADLASKVLSSWSVMDKYVGSWEEWRNVHR